MKDIFSIALFIFIMFGLDAQINFQSSSEFKYLEGKDASAIQSDWMTAGYDDSAWVSGFAPFWYGDGSMGTVLVDMQNTYSTLYLRSTFLCDNAENLDKIVFNVNFDDGFIIWVNGEEVYRNNAPSTPLYNSFAPGMHESGVFEQFNIDSSNINISNGINYIAVQGFNVGLESTDFHFDLQISAKQYFPEYPDTLSLNFSEESGYYDTPFSLEISTPNSDSKIVYTLDGSNPQDSYTSFTVDSIASIAIDPESSVGRALTPAVILRASVVKNGYLPSKPKARTYIFLDKVKNQTYPGGNWPSASINNQTIDLDVDPRIINHVDYEDLIDDAFYEIPSISIITDLKNLFNPVTGIYVNAFMRGDNWERECSVNLLNPDKSKGFSVNAGLRIRGGFSRAPEFAKHGFRLFFNSVYGDSKLRYPLFDIEGVERFDNMDLRTAQNYAWSNGDSRNTMVKEVFSRDSQRDLGQPYTRSRYYHLYLNGMYWGLFQTQERSEADYASDYLGGSADDYDVVKVTGAPNYDIEATDGSLSSWLAIYNRTQQGFSNNSDYFELEGKDENGEHILHGNKWVDIDNLIDFMLVIFYTANWDGPVSEPLNNKHPNNFYATYNRENNAEGYRFFAHDSEHSILGLHDNRVNIAYRTDGSQMFVGAFKEFHPQWLHHKLTANDEYKQRFMDRAFMHMNDGGAFTPQEALKRFNSRVSQIDTAIIAESARWGDGRGVSPPYTRDDNWIGNVRYVQEEYMPLRTGIVATQLQEIGLYSYLRAPVMLENGILINNPIFKFEESISTILSNPNSNGIIYYTMDGTDPREIGGSISENAIELRDRNNSIVISSTLTIKARVYNSEGWGPVKHILFLKSNEDYSSLKVTELHYNPLDEINGTDTIFGKDFEFIEFKNTGDSPLNLSGLVLDSAVYYEFPENEILEAKHFYVVSSKTVKFYNKYGMKSSGNYSGNFSNSGEEVLLHDSEGNTIIHFEYYDDNPWPDMADGFGYSLVSVALNPIDDPYQIYYWKGSGSINGSPFANEAFPESVKSNQIQGADVVIYPNPTTDLVNIFVNSDSKATEMMLEIYSISGTLLHQSIRPLKTSISMQKLNFEHGIYIIKVNCDGFSGSYRLVY